MVNMKGLIIKPKRVTANPKPTQLLRDLFLT